MGTGQAQQDPGQGRAVGSWRLALLQQGPTALGGAEVGPWAGGGGGEVVRTSQACGCPQGPGSSFPSSKVLCTPHGLGSEGPCNTAIQLQWGTHGLLQGIEPKCGQRTGKGHGMRDLGSNGEVQATLDKPQRGEGGPGFLSQAPKAG